MVSFNSVLVVSKKDCKKAVQLFACAHAPASIYATDSYVGFNGDFKQVIEADTIEAMLAGDDCKCLMVYYKISGYLRRYYFLSDTAPSLTVIQVTGK